MIARSSKHSVVATHAGGEAFTVAVRGHTVRTDQPRSAGGDDSAPTPLELMSVGLAACVALYAHRFCVANGIDACDAAVEVVPVWRADPGRIARFDVLLHLPETVSETVAAQLEQVARQCPVHHTLGERAEIEVKALTSARELRISRSSAA
jgi:putative redox protein